DSAATSLPIACSLIWILKAPSSLTFGRNATTAAAATSAPIDTAAPRKSNPLRFVQDPAVGRSSATCTSALNPRIDGTSRLFPQLHRIACPAWPVCTGRRELQAGQGSKYFMDAGILGG